MDLSQIQTSKTAYSLFPGQIVAVEGMNTTGRKLVASRICEGASHKPTTSAVKQLREFSEMQGASSLKIVTACGPYTTSDNLDYEPFIDLMNNVLEQAPDVVILIGPFVDLRHDSIKNGSTKVELEGGGEMVLSYETYFANKITSLLEEVLFDPEANSRTQFILVPSLDDATANWV